MSSRKGRAQTARETLEILETGFYESPSGQRVDLAEPLKYAIEQSQLYAPQQYPEVFSLRDVRKESTPCRGPTRFEVIKCTTLAACRRLVEQDHREDVLCLNFASAKNPGGGFQNGSQAQEESLARASGLYACINPLQTMYETNRRYRSSLYTDHMIYSPQVPVFRDDDDVLLESPWRVSMLTAPAVNAGAVQKNEPENTSRIQETMIRRIEKLLSIAVVHGHCTLVLGAWGCGVFRNCPSQVAEWFHYHLLENETFCNTFERVVFAVLDHGKDLSTIAPFQARFA
ncbi:MAG: TIGR02452 family protein [Planctomycetaceae bacterium]|nr:TIGR02452 family protein [Planctomycetaceae bacterium]